MIAIIDSGGANITSVISAFDRLDVRTVFTTDANIIRAADKVVLPGVGAAGDAMNKLRASNLIDVIKSLTQPVFGICIGMQLLFEHSDENDVDLLGLIPSPLKRFADGPSKTVPHMGWNNIHDLARDHPLLHGLNDESYFYFVHSFRADVIPHTIATCAYSDEAFSAVIAHKNFVGCQFHPERSGKAGAKILSNFIRNL